MTITTSISSAVMTAAGTDQLDSFTGNTPHTLDGAVGPRPRSTSPGDYQRQQQAREGANEISRSVAQIRRQATATSSVLESTTAQLRNPTPGVCVYHWMPEKLPYSVVDYPRWRWARSIHFEVQFFHCPRHNSRSCRCTLKPHVWASS